MAKEPTYPVDSMIKIKHPGQKPSNWNHDMMAMIGDVYHVQRADPPSPGGLYRYYLVNCQWTWRHQDLELLKLPTLDPNSAFRNRKI